MSVLLYKLIPRIQNTLSHATKMTFCLAYTQTTFLNHVWWQPVMGSCIGDLICFFAASMHLCLVVCNVIFLSSSIYLLICIVLCLFLAVAAAFGLFLCCQLWLCVHSVLFYCHKMSKKNHVLSKNYPSQKRTQEYIRVSHQKQIVV